MNLDIVTLDLSQFGYRELCEAAELIKKYGENGADFLNDGITLNFNRESGKVFLSDEDYNVGVLEDEKLVQFFSCPVCGFEGTLEEGLQEGKDFDEYEGFCSKSCEDENEGR